MEEKDKTPEVSIKQEPPPPEESPEPEQPANPPNIDTEPDKPSIEEIGGFSGLDLANLKDIYDFFDRSGAVKKSQILEIFEWMKQQDDSQSKPPPPENSDDEAEEQPLSFYQFAELVWENEGMIDLVKQSTPNLIQAEQRLKTREFKFDSKIIDFLRLLEEYRRKCQAEGNLAEA